jgi:hypothetical protein
MSCRGPQPGGFEGFGFAGESLDTNDHAVADGVHALDWDARPKLRCAYAACGPLALEAVEADETSSGRIDVLAELELNARERFAKRTPAVAEGVTASKSLQSAEGDPLDFLGNGGVERSIEATGRQLSVDPVGAMGHQVGPKPAGPESEYERPQPGAPDR